MAFLEPDSMRSETIHPGVVHHYVWSPAGPWAVHLIEASLGARCELGFEVLTPPVRDAGRGGHARVTEMAAGAGERLIAAVNADFFTPEGTVVGSEIVDGVVRSAEPRPVFAWRPGAAPWLGTPVVTADAIDVGWRVELEGGDGLTEAVGGFPDLIDHGRRVGDLEVSARPSFAAARHPRTAVGYDSTRGVLWLVVVDGRQSPYSAGMTLPELADLLEALGTDEAINLDGGGSSALVLDGSPVNRPSDPTGERPVVNALALVRDVEACRISSGLSLPR